MAEKSSSVQLKSRGLEESRVGKVALPRAELGCIGTSVVENLDSNDSTLV